jgi:hypothetical protein
MRANPDRDALISAMRAAMIDFSASGATGSEGDLQSGYREGTYVPVRAAMKFTAGRLLGKKFSLGRENRRELCREVADVIPYMYIYFQKLLSRR